MSMEVVILPALFDAACLLATLMQEHKRATIQSRFEKGLLSEHEKADLDAEIEALSQSGCQIDRTSGRTARGSHIVVHTDRDYDIGLRRNKNGAYDVLAHWETQAGGAQVREAQAEVANQIRQRYAYEKVRRELAKKGFIVSSEEVEPDRTIKLVVRKW